LGPALAAGRENVTNVVGTAVDETANVDVAGGFGATAAAGLAATVGVPGIAGAARAVGEVRAAATSSARVRNPQDAGRDNIAILSHAR
jgi:hypothetical protein